MKELKRAQRAQNLIRFFIIEEKEGEKERKRKIIFGKRTMRTGGGGDFQLRARRKIKRPLLCVHFIDRISKGAAFFRVDR